MAQTLDPEGPLSGAPGAPQFRIGRPGLVAECGSSMINSASKHHCRSGQSQMRLVRLVLIVTVMLTGGTTGPGRRGYATGAVQRDVAHQFRESFRADRRRNAGVGNTL